MNFISRNLGWILLFLFFLFMLFVISTNQNKSLNDANNSGSIDTSTESGSTSLDDEDEETGELDNLIDQLENPVSDEADVEETDEEASDDDEKSSIFDFFTGGSKDKDEDDESTSTGSTSTGSTASGATDEGDQGAETPADNTETSTETPVGSVSEDKTSGLSKTTGKSTPKAITYAFNHIDPINLPGVNLKTSVGKTYEIGVHSLKLNNANFNQTLAYMMKGDQVKQLTSENSFGCFQVAIVNSVRTHNNGKIGYVCKKYLTESKNESDTTAPSNNNNVTTTPPSAATTSSLQHTSIGSYFKINVDDTCFKEKDSSGEYRKFNLNRGDVLKQVSEVNRGSGCTQMKVVGARIDENHGKIITICSSDMVSPVTQ